MGKKLAISLVVTIAASASADTINVPGDSPTIKGGIFVAVDGDEVVVATTPWGKAGLATCYDLRFPEFYRKMLEAGAKFFLVASAWPEARLEAWRLFNRARAHENLAFLFSCNCAGSNVGTPYAGHSMFVDPLGKVIAEGGEKEEFISAEVDSNLADSVRDDFPALEDRVFV